MGISLLGHVESYWAKKYVLKLVMVMVVQPYKSTVNHCMTQVGELCTLYLKKEVKNISLLRYLIRIMLNIEINLERTDIFTMVSVPNPDFSIYLYHLCFHSSVFCCFQDIDPVVLDLYLSI